MFFMFFSCFFHVLLTVSGCVFISGILFSLFSCIAASLLNKLTYLFIYNALYRGVIGTKWRSCCDHSLCRPNVTSRCVFGGAAWRGC